MILKTIESLSLNTIEVLFIISYVILATLMMGLTIFSPNIYEIIKIILQILISFFIIFKFNPFTRRTMISQMERKIIFSSGVYLFLATVPFHYLTGIYL